MLLQRVSLCLVFLSCAASVLSAAEPVGWRGDGTGRYPDAKPPLEWSPQKNVLWVAKTASWSNATPVPAGDKVFICADPSTLICIDAKTGAELWNRPVDLGDTLSAEERPQLEAAKTAWQATQPELDRIRKELGPIQKGLKDKPDDPALKKQLADLQARQKELQTQLQPYEKYRAPGTNGTAGYSTPTPVTDGQHVWVLFGTRVAACFSLAGERRWCVLLTQGGHGWGLTASPVLADGKVIFALQDLFALDAATGKPVWRAPSKGHPGSPVLTKIGDVKVLVTTEGQIVRVADGKVLCAKLGDLEYNAPIVQDGVIYTVDRETARAWKLPAKADETIQCEKLWETPIVKNRYYASAVYHEGILYGVAQSGAFTTVDAKTGAKVYEQKLNFKGGLAYPSLTIAGNYLYLSEEKGTTLVIQPGREYKELGHNQLPDGFRSSPVFADGRLYLRALKGLYCLGPAGQ